MYTDTVDMKTQCDASQREDQAALRLSIYETDHIFHMSSAINHGCESIQGIEQQQFGSVSTTMHHQPSAFASF